MARRQSDGPSKTDIDMTPMIDMTFQLITFFVFTLNFSTAVQDERLQLPVSQLAKPADGPSIDPITLQLMNDGRVIYMGEPLPLVDMRGYLENERRLMLETGREPGSATVIIRADGRARTGEVQELIKLCQDKGFEKFVLRAQYDEGK